MKKKRFIYLIMSMLLVFSLFAGCSKRDEKTDTKPSEKQEGITVTFYDSDGTTVLKTEMIESGAKATEYTPEKEGYEFVGWFATPQMSHVFDFTNPITKDTSIFGGFVQFQEDTREYAIVGSGKSTVLLSSSWGNTINDEHKLTKNPDANEYSITLDLYEGDEFQFAINTSWDNQRGYGYLTTIERDGTNYFINSGAYGDSTVRRSNIKVAVTGNYTFTLTTHPADDTYETDNANYTEENKEKFNINPYDTITWTFNGELQSQAIEIQTDYYIKGSGVTNWKDIYTDRTKFVEKDGLRKLIIPLKEGEEFLFTSMVTADGVTSTGAEYIRFSNLDEASKEFLYSSESYNMIAKANGLYEFTYDPETTILIANCDTTQFLPKYEYYMKGSFGGTSWGTEGNKDYQLMESEEGSYIYVLKALTLEAGDELGMQSMEGTERVLFYNYNYLAAADDSNSNADFDAKNDTNANIVAKVSGTYKVTYNAYTDELMFTLAN